MPYRDKDGRVKHVKKLGEEVPEYRPEGNLSLSLLTLTHSHPLVVACLSLTLTLSLSFSLSLSLSLSLSQLKNSVVLTCFFSFLCRILSGKFC